MLEQIEQILDHAITVRDVVYVATAWVALVGIVWIVGLTIGFVSVWRKRRGARS